MPVMLTRCIAPTGYINRTSEAGKKYNEPHEPQASIMKWAFESLAEGCFNPEQIYKMAKEKGLKSTKSNFWMNIRNPLYCGKIVIPKFTTALVVASAGSGLNL